MLNQYYTEIIPKNAGIARGNGKKDRGERGKKEIEIEQNPKEQECPKCQGKTRRIHDYRQQKIRDMKYFGQTVILRLRKRRYV